MPLIRAHPLCRQPNCAGCRWRDRLEQALSSDPLTRELHQDEGYLGRPDPDWVEALRWEDAPSRTEMIDRVVGLIGGRVDFSDEIATTVRSDGLELRLRHFVTELTWLATFASESVAAVFGGQLPDERVMAAVIANARPRPNPDPVESFVAEKVLERAREHFRFRDDTEQRVCGSNDLWMTHRRVFDELPGMVDEASIAAGRPPSGFDFETAFRSAPEPTIRTPAGAVSVHSRERRWLATQGEIRCGHTYAWDRKRGEWRLQDGPDGATCPTTARWAERHEHGSDTWYRCNRHSEGHRWRTWARFHPVLKLWCDGFFGQPYRWTISLEGPS